MFHLEPFLWKITEAYGQVVNRGEGVELPADLQAFVNLLVRWTFIASNGAVLFWLLGYSLPSVTLEHLKVQIDGIFSMHMGCLRDSALDSSSSQLVWEIFCTLLSMIPLCPIYNTSSVPCCLCPSCLPLHPYPTTLQLSDYIWYIQLKLNQFFATACSCLVFENLNLHVTCISLGCFSIKLWLPSVQHLNWFSPPHILKPSQWWSTLTWEVRESHADDRWSWPCPEISTQSFNLVHCFTWNLLWIYLSWPCTCPLRICLPRLD